MLLRSGGHDHGLNFWNSQECDRLTQHTKTSERVMGTISPWNLRLTYRPKHSPAKFNGTTQFREEVDEGRGQGFARQGGGIPYAWYYVLKHMSALLSAMTLSLSPSLYMYIYARTSLGAFSLTTASSCLFSLLSRPLLIYLYLYIYLLSYVPPSISLYLNTYNSYCAFSHPSRSTPLSLSLRMDKLLYIYLFIYICICMCRHAFAPTLIIPM